MGEFGTNQKIAVAVIGTTIMASIAFVLLSKLSGDQWLQFCGEFVKWSLLIVLGGSAGIKISQAFGHAPPPEVASPPAQPPAPTP